MGLSHHQVLSFVIEVDVPFFRQKPTTRYLYDKGNYTGMREQMKNIDWKLYFKEEEDVNQEGAISAFRKTGYLLSIRDI